MTPKPYKENKSQLRQFLERKNVTHVPKEARGKEPKILPTNKYYLMLKRLSETGTEEDKARLAAVDWNDNLQPDKKVNKYQWEIVEEMRQTDGEHDPDIFWTYLIYGGRKRIVGREKGYYVAGKRFESRQEFLLSLTGLGRELL